MAATRQDVDRWKANAKRDGADWLIVVCDSWDYEDYPVFVKGDLDKLEKAYLSYHGKDMQHVMEIIDIQANIEDLNLPQAKRVWQSRNGGF